MKPDSSRRRFGALPLLLLAAAPGCFGPNGPHVTLNAPAADAPVEDRLAAYQNLAPERMTTVHVINARNSAELGQYDESIEFHDGTKVVHVEDLSPVVAPESRAAKWIEKSQSSSSKGKWLMAGGIAGLFGGFALIVADLASNGIQRRGVPFYLGAGIGIGGLVTIPFSLGQFVESNAARSRALKHYDEGLRLRLDLCRDGQEVLPCR